jgi:predicted RNase H-like HicB family nuclease
VCRKAALVVVGVSAGAFFWKGTPPLNIDGFHAVFSACMQCYAQGTDIADALSRMESAVNSASEEFTPENGYYIGRVVAVHILRQYPLYTDNGPLLICFKVLPGVSE